MDYLNSKIEKFEIELLKLSNNRKVLSTQYAQLMLKLSKTGSLAEYTKLNEQIEKLVDVIKAFVHEENEIVFQELALYKIKTASISNGEVEQVIRDHHARILSVDPLFMVVEKTGHVADTQLLFEKLKPFGILEFARSGGVAVTKPMKELSTYLKELKVK